MGVIFFGFIIVCIIIVIILVYPFIKHSEERKKAKEVLESSRLLMKELGIENKSVEELKKEVLELELEQLKLKVNKELISAQNYISIDMNNSDSSCNTKVVGVTYGNRQEYLKECYEGQDIKIKWDTKNKYSDHALAVYVEIDEKQKQIGFIPDETAEDLCNKYFTDEDDELSGYITEITGGTDDKPTLGCNIEIII